MSKITCNQTIYKSLKCHMEHVCSNPFLKIKKKNWVVQLYTSWILRMSSGFQDPQAHRSRGALALGMEWL